MAQQLGVRTGRRVAAVVAVGLLMGAVAPTALAQSLASQGSAAGVSYSAATVLIPKSLVSADLKAVSPNGATYTFTSDTGALRRLKKGSVMLLQGVAVRNVTGVSKNGSGLVVSSTAAAITDLINNGTLSWSKAVDFANAYAIRGAAVPIETARDTNARDALLSRFGLSALAGKKFTIKGSTHSYKYSVTFTSEGKAVGVDITISKSTAVDLSVTISGTLDGLSSTGAMALNNQHLKSAHMTASGLKGQFKVSYSVKPLSQFGLGSAGNIKITLPAEITLPFEVGPVPFFLGIKTAFFASVGFSNFDQSVNGSYTINYDGKGGFTTSSSGATSALGALQGVGKIILDAANAVKTGPLSVIFGAQVPQLELGLGVKGLNVGGFVTLVAQTGVSTYGSGCDTRGLEVLGSAGAEANFFGFSAPLGAATLFDKKVSAAYPAGCGTFPGF
jgi:hypothetical protein